MTYGIGLLLAVLVQDAPLSIDAKTLFKPESFQTLVDPDCSYCHVEADRAGESLRSEDRVLSWIRGDHEGGAIPYRWFLVPYRVISDTYGVFVYDADADFVRGWPASVDYRFHGWRNGVMVMRHKDGTLFDCLTGEAFDGPRKGIMLKPIPTLETNWGPWRSLYPKTVAYTMKPIFKPVPIPSAVLAESRGTRVNSDTRLDPDARVFGLAVDKSAVAWPVAEFGSGVEVRRVKVGETETQILWDGRVKTATAFALRTEGKSPEPAGLSVDMSDPNAPFVDRETGSRWTIAGRASSGPRKGESLQWLPGVTVKWYAWATGYPKTEIREFSENDK